MQSRTPAFGKRASTRSRISAAAFAVKVRARIFSGCTPLIMRYWIRLVSTDVFPEPAPARIRRAPFCLWSCKTAMRWSPFRPFKMLSASIGYRVECGAPKFAPAGYRKGTRWFPCPKHSDGRPAKRRSLRTDSTTNLQNRPVAGLQPIQDRALRRGRTGIGPTVPWGQTRQ